MADRDGNHSGGGDEAFLAPFFAEARAGRPAPTTALLSAILADAAAETAARAARPAEPRRRRLEPIGGWRGLAALAACALLGFWLGLAGDVTLDAAPGWTALETAASAVDVGDDDDEVGAFFDLAAAEG